MDALYIIEGQILPLRKEALTSARARATYAALQWYHYYQLLDAKIFEEFGLKFDALIVEVSPELPQVKKHDIRYREPLALCFDHEDRGLPRVQALRKDFPFDVSHLNLVPADTPRELCLYNEPLDVVRLTWTAPEFLGRITTWLAKTATGTLHAPDQPLEPFLLPLANEVIVPCDLFGAPKPDGKRLVAFPIVRQEKPLRYSVRLQWQPVKEALKRPWVLFVLLLRTAPRVHGLIHEASRHLKDLHDLLAREGIGFIEWLRENLRELYVERPSPRDCDLLLVLLEIPQQRTPDSSVERTEQWALVIGKNIIETSLAVRACAKSPEGRYVPLLTFGKELPLEADALTQIPVEPLRVIPELTRQNAINYSGITSGKTDLRCVLVGTGALGSQIYLALARMGWGDWRFVDEDVFLPHNTVRHVLGDACVGFYKAQALRWTAELLVPYNAPRDAISANAMDFARNELLAQAFKEADMILDASTSLAVARALARDVDTRARLVSAFLTPSGKDSAIMIESADRTYRLDALEQQYYRAILRDERLEGHLERHSGSLRYGGSCRDVTTFIAQDDIILHAGILAKQVRRGVEQDDPQLTIWRSSEDGSVERISIAGAAPRSDEVAGWRILYDHALIERCYELRSHKLPNETGGILVGYFDALRKILYLVDALPAPPDSLEHKTAFIRGVKGLRASLATIGEKTAQIVHYVGEWHSHPIGVDVQMSRPDECLLREIADEMRFEGWPGIILIVGDERQCAVYVEASAIS
jgi:hypothetical protein